MDVYIRLPPPIAIFDKSYGIVDLVRHWVDTAPPFQAPISRIRLGIKVLERADAMSETDGWLCVPEEAANLFKELAAAANVPTWNGTVDGKAQRLEVPARLYLPLLEAFDRSTSSPPTENPGSP